MNKELYLQMTNEVKEVLTNMPQNNKKNKQKYLVYVKEQLDIYNKKKEELIEELKKRNNLILEKEKEVDINKETLEATKKQILDKLLILETSNTPYEKIGLDKTIYNINKYYEENLESLNEEIHKAINCFKEVGVILTSKDFWYSKHLSKYMYVLLNSKDSNEIKKTFNTVYWKFPNIVNQIAMNLKHLYYKYEKNFINYYKIKTQQILSQTTKEKLIIEYNNIQNKLEEDYYSIHNISDRFLKGEDSIADFSTDKYDSYIESITNKENDYDNLIKFNNTIKEYKMYLKYKYIIDAFIELYKEKDKYKNVYKALKNDIKKEEKKLLKTNKKIISQEKWFKDNNKIEMLEINVNNIIAGLKEKYNDLEIQKINELISISSDNLSYYDILKIAATNYIYIRKILISNNPETTDEEIDEVIKELTEFIYRNNLTILDNLSVLTENSIPKIISNNYKLLNIKVEENDLESNVDNYVELLRKIRIINYLNSSNLSYDELLFQVEAQKIINS